ncbi:unnamed protein product, partial [marine sediment metagenome]
WPYNNKYPGDKIIVSKDVAERWEQVELAKIIKK